MAAWGWAWGWGWCMPAAFPLCLRRLTRPCGSLGSAEASSCPGYDAPLPLLPQQRLEKEKKLSKDLGQAATKLQQLLKASQDQLAKEKETVLTLQGCLDGKVELLLAVV